MIASSFHGEDVRRVADALRAENALPAENSGGAVPCGSAE